MRLSRVTVSNFRSFVGEQRFEFPEGPGLYQMVGVNEAEPRLGANGAGKTSLWDAVSWCFYGSTPSGLKAGDVCSWGVPKGVSVAAVLEDTNGVEFTVTRTWGPISFKLRTHDVTGGNGDFDDVEDVDGKDPNNAVVRLLRLGENPWLQSVLMAQGQPMFLDLKADAQAALFGKVMGLDKWLAWSAAASEKALAQDGALRKLERELAELEGRLAAASRGDARTRREKWEADRRLEADDIVARHEALMLRRRGLNDDRLVAEEDELNRRALYQQAKNDSEPRREELGAAEAWESDTGSWAALSAREAEAARSVADTFSGGGDCPTCGHRPNKAELGAARAKTLSAAAKAEDQFREAQESWRRAKDRLESAARGWAKAASNLDDLQQDLDSASQRAADLRRELQRADADLDRLEDDAARLDRQPNPYAQMADDQTAELADAAKRLAECRREADGCAELHSVYQFWVRGMKEVRLRQISEALAELEVEVNSCCAALGLVGWEIRFAVDKENKGGGIKTGFSVSVIGPSSEKPVPWAAWSGGEKQRLRVAANMGLADLIRSRTGADLALELWDEPTQGLHAGGVQDLLFALESRARDEGRQIWIVDHRTHSFGGFAGGAVVTKTKRGSSIGPL